MVGAAKRGGRGRMRSRLAVAVLAVSVLAGAAGCTGGGTADNKPSPAASPADPPPRTERQLTAAALSDGERAGAYTVSTYPLGGPLDTDYTAAPAVCQPLVSLAPGVSGFRPAAEVGRRAEDPRETLGVTVDVRLRSYAGQGAARVMKALTTAGRACAGGFTEDRLSPVRAKYLAVETVKAPYLGDDSVAYRFTILDVRGKKKLYEYLTVVRSGSTTLSFRAEVTGTKDVGAVPADVIRAQWATFDAS
ncbi:hypothetical protein OG349_09695 [Streptomyces sp. NBC_01317]|uniref:hypothetical protein n=1 Tax=Streptomyces sp. NBC_01317 TaxID=2903822 RepID=UPI002E129834|nr:hypothetical protein OG349_09695 [Streptomyces sp. NBC_01317]